MPVPANQLLGVSEIAAALDADRQMLGELAREFEPVGVFRGVRVYDLNTGRAIAAEWQGLSEAAFNELRRDARARLKADLIRQTNSTSSPE